MSTLEEHDAEQAYITARCEAGLCDHDDCKDPEGRAYMDEIVDRSAPRWAWEIIDETLDMDAVSSAFSGDLREGIRRALMAMQIACDRADDQPLSPEDVKAWEADYE